MTKTSKLFIFGALAILIIGLAIGAYFFFFQADDEATETQYYESGEIEKEIWLLNDQLHRENDKPAYIEYDESGEIELEEWWLNSELIKTQPPSM